MQTTLETTPSSAELERRLGRALWLQTKPWLDQAQRQEPDPAHARRQRTQDLEALVADAIAQKRALLETQHRSARTMTVIDHLTRCEQKPPTPAVIRRVLKNHGLY